LEAEIRAKRAE